MNTAEAEKMVRGIGEGVMYVFRRKVFKDHHRGVIHIVPRHSIYTLCDRPYDYPLFADDGTMSDFAGYPMCRDCARIARAMAADAESLIELEAKP